MNNTGCILMEPAGQHRTAHLSKALALLAPELGRKAFLGSRMGLTESPDGTDLEGEAPVPACGLHQLGLGAPPEFLFCDVWSYGAPPLISSERGLVSRTRRVTWRGSSRVVPGPLSLVSPAFHFSLGGGKVFRTERRT